MGSDGFFFTTKDTKHSELSLLRGSAQNVALLRRRKSEEKEPRPMAAEEEAAFGRGMMRGYGGWGVGSDGFFFTTKDTKHSELSPLRGSAQNVALLRRRKSEEKEPRLRRGGRSGLAAAVVGVVGAGAAWGRYRYRNGSRLFDSDCDCDIDCDPEPDSDPACSSLLLLLLLLSPWLKSMPFAFEPLAQRPFILRGAAKRRPCMIPGAAVFFFFFFFF